ncbi:MAG: DUF1501 domain-containing protein [Planctomycetia bacterium]|nr:DUF1501 domain-containing protein [Planctomycetia bacterium]
MRRCDGVNRRALLRAGALAGLGLIPSLLRGRAMAGHSRPRAKSCILLWFDGGPSHLETFDVKPDAPREVRGPFASIATATPGLRVSELLPATARIADRITVIRSMTSPLGEHGLANEYLLTGYKPSPALTYPSYGAVLSNDRAAAHELPANIAIPRASAPMGVGFLNARHRPFNTGGDPADADFRVEDLDFFPGVDGERMARRREFVAHLDRLQARVESRASSADLDPVLEQAYQLVTSPSAKRAFHLQAETDAVRAQYGPRTFGQSCLLARRLVELGVPFVTVFNPGWDTHDNLVVRLKEGYAGAKVGVGLIPTFDQAFAALVTDLDERGLLDDTLVIAMGEFGRTPKLNSGGGRDHWPRVFSMALAGAGIPGGQVVGASDRTGESPAERPITPVDLARTIYVLLGIDPDAELHTQDGRPVRINQGGETIRELLG